ncbi:DM13 domain-containing protein [Photobacterium sp. SDRW27]|uniref:DM13 domain-containing protein n=1 Tax=Photobacterium obscurum TaxID=2829490 RepID=UPI002243CE7C|nr:DM13 domain-containing protein [Photobacterium obscurum]MCW8328742.1 DM13 domain-containing protein [Photobacterium obscurum]
MKRFLGLFITHGVAVAVGFALGIYALPILIAPEAPAQAAISFVAENAQYTATFDKERKDSDFLHWGIGEVSVAADAISFVGELAPGPDYKLYLSPEFVETEGDFNRLKASMVKVGEVKTFSSFMVPLDVSVDIRQYNTVIVWCETFGQFITSAQYQ